MTNGFNLTEQQIWLLEKANPKYNECHVANDSSGGTALPGYLLRLTCQGVGRIYLQAVVDAYGNFAFGKMHTSKRQETTADVLYDSVLPFYQSQWLVRASILTDNGTDYKNPPMIYLDEIFLELNDFEHRTMKVANSLTNDFVKRFNRTLLDEFFGTAFRK